jgi:hypothetical protein
MIRFAVLSTIILLASCSCHSAYAQNDTPVVNEIRHYVRYIDSVSELGHGQRPDLSSSIADGIIENDNREVIGGFGVYTLSNSKRDTAFRIAYQGYLGINIHKTYYYRHNKLIYARLQLRDSISDSKTLYQKEEFYRDDHVIGTKIDSVKEGEQYLAWTTLPLFKDGSRYLDDFMKEYRH